MTQPNGIRTAYTYDGLNRLTHEQVENLGTEETVFDEVVAWYNDGRRSGVTDTRYEADGDVLWQVETTWEYDAMGRLTDEAMEVLQTGTGVPAAYQNIFAYDLASNRVRQDIDGGDSVEDGKTIVYTYTDRDQVLTEDETEYDINGPTAVYSIEYEYDESGNLTTQTRTGEGAVVSTYEYDQRDRMTSAEVGAATTTYGYGTDGVRVRTSTGQTNGDTYYLNDPHNPTGYTKAIQESDELAGAPKRSYVLGLKVEAQADPGAQTNDPPVVVYFVTDGHGSTRALTDASGAIALKDATAQVFDYDAFGKALDFDPSAALTAWLFAGDGRYDASTGWSYQLARWRNGFWFTQADTFQGFVQDPITLHKYLYAGADPIAAWDYTGRTTKEELVTTTSTGAVICQAATTNATSILQQIRGVLLSLQCRLVALEAEAEYTVATFRQNLIKLTGKTNYPIDLAEAHHVFPQELAGFFSRAGININFPAFGQWVPQGLHQEGTAMYNRMWVQFFARNPKASVQDIFNAARVFMQEVYQVGPAF